MNETISAIAKKFRLEGLIEKHPHITLFGPLSLNEGTGPEQLLETIGKVASGFGPVPFMIDGWEKRDGMHGSVIAFCVRPSDELKKITAMIAGALTPLTTSYNPWDASPEMKWFHITIANRLDPPRAEGIFSLIAMSSETLPQIDRSLDGIFLRPIKWLLKVLQLRNRRVIWPVTLDEHGLRITVMQGDAILAEYDLLDKCWISKGSRHTSGSWQKSLSRYRRVMGFELAARTKNPGEDLYVISDLHLGHANIIRYCSRPFIFADVAEMDSILIGNWNSVIDARTRVFYLGDLRYGSHSHSAGQYREDLAGNITFIRGNHDEAGWGVPSSIVELRGYTFLLVHDPADTPADFTGWTVHGHYHNNDLHHFPFINFVDRRINVSAEVIGYVPVGLHEICSLLETRQNSGDQSPILLRYPYVS
ncbi:MAG: 2'-5' RNA ligase family protein [Methanomicrobiales archaeon]